MYTSLEDKLLIGSKQKSVNKNKIIQKKKQENTICK